MVKKNTCVFISGKGTNLRNLLLKSREYIFPINIRLVISNNKKAKGLNYARKNGIPILIVNTNNRNYESKIFKISFICLAGYMKIISKGILQKYKKKIINIHPSLLPKFKGLNTFLRIKKNNEVKSGCTVHYVNEKLDSGNIITQKSFFISSEDDEETLKTKTQKLEYTSFPEAIIKVFRN